MLSPKQFGQYAKAKLMSPQKASEYAERKGLDPVRAAYGAGDAGYLKNNKWKK